MTSLRFSLLLVSLALVACTSVANVAHASTVDPSIHSGSAAPDEGDEQRGKPAPAPLQYHQDRDASSPAGEFKASEPKDPEEPAASQASGVGPPVLRKNWAFLLLRERLRFGPVSHAAQFWVSSVLPRGPPYRSR